MKSWHDQDSEKYLHKAEPLGGNFAAEIVYKRNVMATLCGRDADELKARAHRYAAAMHWHRAVVTLSPKSRA